MRLLTACAAALCLIVIAPAASGGTSLPTAPGGVATPLGTASGWSSPVVPLRVASPYRAPADAYSAGHRGVDLAASPDGLLRSPAPGVVAFSSQVADRGVITIDHGDGVVSTLEPVEDALPAGAPVGTGAPVAALGEGGHSSPATVHFGVRVDGEYVNPLLFLGDAPRAVLLPCC